ncbi:MAG: hypothetical protein LBR12_00355 [Opitutaceae bacterium]|jgi:hypothetical protein|nr:hypothetical protein [Opitutaceae bacterium]
MAVEKKHPRSQPLTLDVPRPLLEKLRSRRGRGASVSAFVRAAIETFDYDTLPDRAPQAKRQISFRLTPAARALLGKVSRKKGIPVSGLVRLALENSLKPAPAKASAKVAKPTPAKTAKAAPAKGAKAAAARKKAGGRRS